MITYEAIEKQDQRIGYLMAITDLRNEIRERYIAIARDDIRTEGSLADFLQRKFDERWPNARKAARLAEDIANA